MKMKKANCGKAAMLATIAIIAMVVLPACTNKDNSIAKDLNGKWYSESVDAQASDLKVTTCYDFDYKGENEGLVAISESSEGVVRSEGKEINVNMESTCRGKYMVKDRELFFEVDPTTISVKINRLADKFGFDYGEDARGKLSDGESLRVNDTYVKATDEPMYRFVFLEGDTIQLDGDTFHR